MLCRQFGFEHLQAAEDVVSETFMAALDSWPYGGIPQNPSAWLYAVAKNKFRNHLKRRQVFDEKIAPAMLRSPQVGEIEIDMSEHNISDSQLRMLFAICHPAISAEAQVGLALRILCGFGVEEIASAFLTNKETVNKRLFRAKERLRAISARIEFPPEREVQERLDTVLTTLYLLFNEGYYSENDDRVLRKDLCLEAMRLVRLLLDHPPTDTPQANALLSLMCFHASRFDARFDEQGDMVLYQNQDESLWDAELVASGAFYLQKATQGSQLTRFHIEATIAFWHTQKADTPEKWENVLHLYNHLLALEYSPVAALNRTFALSKVRGKAAAIAEAEKLNLSGDHFYHILLGELYTGVEPSKAAKSLELALELAKTEAERRVIRGKLEALGR